MPLRLVIGGAHSGKTRLLTEALYGTVRQRRSGLLIVPATSDVSRAIAHAASTVALGVAVHTFDDYLDGLWQLIGDGRAIATPVQRIAVLEESVNAWQPLAFSDAGRSRGILGVLEVLVQRAAEAEMKTFDPPVPTEGSDLLRCVDSYSRLLRAAGLVERSEAHRLALQRLDSIALPDLLCLDGFTSLTPAQEAFVLGAAARSTVQIALTFDTGVPATEAAAGLVERLRAVGEVVECSAEADATPAELLRIRHSLGATGSGDVTATGAVVLSEAWGAEAEAARICREVQETLDTGVTPSSIAVVFRDAGEQMQVVRRAFDEADIATTFDARVPFKVTPLGRILLVFLQFDQLSHGHLMDALRSPYCPAAHDVLDAFDARVRGAASRSINVTAWFARSDPATESFLHAIRRARAARADQAEARWYAVLSQMLRYAQAADGNSDALLVDAAAARVFMDAVTGVASVASSPTITSTLVAVLDRAMVALTPSDDPNAVRVMSAERARGGSYACMITAGLTDGSFPRRNREDALTDPAIVADMRRAGIDVQQRSSAEDERLLFYQVASRATQRLVLSRQSYSADGTSIRPSIFVDELLDLYRDPSTHVYWAGEPPVRRLGLDGVAEHPEAPTTERRALRSAMDRDAEDPRVLEARRRATRCSPSLSTEVQRALAGRERFSASEIEAYLKCPYFWCVQRLVRPDELDDRVDHAAVGRLGHDIMRLFYERFPEQTGMARVTLESLDDARQVHAGVAVECLDRVKVATAAEAVACRLMVRRTLGVIESDAEFMPGFTPIAHEWSFGLDEGDSGEQFGDFMLGGRIDRIDRDGEQLVLSDYKSGTLGAEHGAERFADEGVIQLPLYAAVAGQRLGGDVVAMLYRPLKGGKPRGVVRGDHASSAFVRTDVVSDAAAVRGHIADAIDRAAEAVARMRTGDVSPDPRGGRCPEYCPARAYCECWRPSRG